MSFLPVLQMSFKVGGKKVRVQWLIEGGRVKRREGKEGRYGKEGKRGEDRVGEREVREKEEKGKNERKGEGRGE